MIYPNFTKKFKQNLFRKGKTRTQSLINVMQWLPLVSIDLSNHRNLAAEFFVYPLTYFHIKWMINSRLILPINASYLLIYLLQII